MAKKKNRLPLILVIAAVVILVVFVAGNKLGWFGDGNVIKVAVDKVQERTVHELVSASGKIQPEFEVKLSSEVSGEIIELNIKEGDVVRKGQVLCRVKPDILQSGFDQAVASLNIQRATLASSQQQLKQQEANFVNTEATFKRNQELFKKRVISAAEMDKAEADYRSALASIEAQRQSVRATRYGIDQSQASVKQAGDNLARTTIYAPSDGVISLLSVELGERVVGTAQMAGTEIMRIANMSSMEVNVDVNENDINRVKLGDQADIEVDAFQGRKFVGVVTEIASSSKSAATTTAASTAEQVTNFNVKVRISPESYADILNNNLKNPSPFRPGLSATVQIRTKTSSGLVVPIQSVTIRTDEIKSDETKGDDAANKEDKTKKAATTENAGAKEYVFVVNGKEVDMVEVKTGIQDDNYIIILSGLKKDQEVVSRPFNAISKTLKDKSKVEKVDKDKLN
ncbi:Macrolide-specific efflux protein macA precursor [Sphingobacterium spiritivorum]|uniref:Macrolide-specific efflux protein macA n=1 Tax=Sphingobacterium spiritivorum TaxID=258 RepID=A0A380CR85_SPHSI|nr:efflux RND transporter periplasmic adaptor subunit [Sphingobacterium spiritivorum]SUJ27065.1 Macrolide-specific efflux protein macA precursor [Sphingobacterium spiritivorum]